LQGTLGLRLVQLSLSARNAVPLVLNGSDFRVIDIGLRYRVFCTKYSKWKHNVGICMSVCKFLLSSYITCLDEILYREPT
jgi:hypothetical protein